MINEQKTYFPTYRRFQSKLWKMHISKKVFSENKPLSIKNWVLEVVFGYFFEKYGYKQFDYIVCGNDPLSALISALEKVQIGKSVIIYPSKTDDADVLINQLLDLRTNMISDSVIIFLSEKYGLEVGEENNLVDILTKLTIKINEFRDANGEPLCYLYKGHSLYSHAGEAGIFYDKQIFWPRHDYLKPDEKWNAISRQMNIFSLLMHSSKSKNREIRSFITAGGLIRTSRTSSSFCKDFNYKEINISDAIIPIDKMDKFSLKHRMIDILMAMGINRIENESEFYEDLCKMYIGAKNAR